MASTSVAEGYKKSEKKSADSEKKKFSDYLDLSSKEKVIKLLEKEMKEAAEKLDFETAMEIRDRIFELKEL